MEACQTCNRVQQSPRKKKTSKQGTSVRQVTAEFQMVRIYYFTVYCLRYRLHHQVCQINICTLTHFAQMQPKMH